MLLASPDQPVSKPLVSIPQMKGVIHIASKGKTHLKTSFMGQQKNAMGQMLWANSDQNMAYHAKIENLEQNSNSAHSNDTPAHPKVWLHYPNFGKEKPLWVRRKHFNACLLNEINAYTNRTCSTEQEGGIELRLLASVLSS